MSLDATATGETTLDRFIALKERKADIERDLRLLKAELGPLEEELLEDYAQRGIKGERHAATGRLVSINRRVWARAADGDKPAACRALAEAGLTDYVEESFNTNSLSAYFRELLKTRVAETGEPVTDLTELLPAPLRGAIELTEDHTLTVRS